MESCLYCKKHFDEIDHVCPYCKKDNDTTHLTEYGIHLLHQNAHNKITKANEKKDFSLVCIVLATLALVIGIIFLILSFKYSTIKRENTFTPLSLEFIVCVLCLASCLILYSIGIPNLIIALNRVKFFKNVVKKTSDN